MGDNSNVYLTSRINSRRESDRMAEKEQKFVNQVHQNAILVEQITKERQHAVLSTNCNPNPRKKYFDGAEKPNSEHATEGADDIFRARAEKVNDVPKVRYGDFPLSSNQEYGWDCEPLMSRATPYPYSLNHPKKITTITKNGYIKR